MTELNRPEKSTKVWKFVRLYLDLGWTEEEHLAIRRLDFKSGTPVSTNEIQPSVIQSSSTSRGQGTGPSFEIF